MTDTIVALSSGAPPAAIAVVRASGPDAHRLLETLAGVVPPFRSLALRTIRDPATGEVLDRGLIVAFPAEGSVSGEPLVELHLHGGRATVNAVLAAAEATGLARPARPGEFTWRAFRHGKMDLIEVESVSDLLRAETETQRRAALASSGLSAAVESCRRRLLQLSALVEAALDQSDEDDVPADRAAIDQGADALLAELGRLLDRPPADRLFDGVRVVFAGAPNTGKSTLINALAQREVAIVSPIAGTTRDVIEAPVTLAGVAFVLTDTAGLRTDGMDAIEQEGIARARQRMADAEIIVWLDDTDPPADMSCWVLPINARSDLPDRRNDGIRLAVSAATGEGVADLIARIVEHARSLLPREGEAALGRRQREHLASVQAHLTAFKHEVDELIAAEHLRRGRQELDALTGRAGTEDMLDALFATFCVGK